MEQRDTTKADAQELIDLIVASFSDLELRTGLSEDLEDRRVCELAMPEWNQNGVCVVDTQVTPNKIISCNFVSPKELGSPHIRSIGPVAVHPQYQGKGVGRIIMELAIKKAQEQGATSLRLTVDTHNPTSFSLYSRLGFEIRDVLALVGPKSMPSRRINVKDLENQVFIRPMKDDDVESVGNFVQRFCGFDRRNEIRAYLETGKNLALGRTSVPFVAWSRTPEPKIVGFLSGIAAAAISAAENEDIWQYLFGNALNYANGYDADVKIDFQGFDSLLSAPPSTDPTLSISMINCSRYPSILRWLLVDCGLTTIKGMYAMEHGRLMISAPREGVWMQSVEY